MESIKCPSCKTVFVENKETCSACNFPFKGTEQEKSVHIGQFILKKGVVIDASDYLKKTQNILYAIAGLLGISLIILVLSKNYYTIDLVFNGSLIIVFICCGVFIKKNPILLIVLPLFLIIGVYLLNYLVDPNTLLQGIFIKTIIIGSLIYSIYLQLKASKFKEKYTELDENKRNV